MSAVTEYHDGSGWVDISDRVPLEEWELREDAEEGSAPTSTISVADAALDFEPHGHRPFRVREDTSTSDDDILFHGFTWNDDTGRGSGEKDFEPLARNIQEQANDANAIWQRPVLIGSDANRPAETDVARVQWVLGTGAFAIFDDVTTYVHTDAPKNMDANDYRGQSGDQVMRDAAEEGGKNWWAKYIGNGVTRPLCAWFGRDSHSTYDSDLFLTNDPTQWSDDELLAGTSVTWPGQDWKVSRDYSRIYCGIYAQYDGGATFRHDSTTHAAYFGDPGADSHRIMVVPMPNVHSKTTAQARADRMLVDIRTPDIHVTTTVRLPAAIATKMRAGMRIPILLTNEPEFSDGWKWCRIVNANVKPVAAGEFYDIAIEATPTGPPDSSGPPAPPYDGQVFAGLQRTEFTGGGSSPVFLNAYPAAQAAIGWDTIETTGPITIDQGSAPYSTITVSEPMVVRIRAIGEGSEAYFPSITVALNVTVNGVIVGTDSRATGTGFQAWTREVDLRDYRLEAGDVVSISGTVLDDWGNRGTNETFLQVGRGTFINPGNGSTTFEGP